MFEGDVDFEFEPCDGIEFQSHEESYSFYQEYAKSTAFATSIKNSRVYKGPKPNDKWIIHEFVKEHNHELLPALAYHFRIHRNVELAEKNNIDILHAISERTRKMYVEMSRQSGGYQNAGFVKSEMNTQFGKGRQPCNEEVFPNTRHCFSLWHILERQLNSIAHSHDGFFGTQQSMHGLGQFDFRPPTSFSYSMQVSFGGYGINICCSVPFSCRITLINLRSTYAYAWQCLNTYVRKKGLSY
uniref:Protein FAR1-RELATED SEQUENCE n=1 Tax=Populus trichocarpa TaxID=3694 RepID=B9IHB6_POPTR